MKIQLNKINTRKYEWLAFRAKSNVILLEECFRGMFLFLLLFLLFNLSFLFPLTNRGIYASLYMQKHVRRSSLIERESFNVANYCMIRIYEAKIPLDI